MTKLSLICALLLVGCATDNDLTQAYFEYDPKYPGLPKYTELGLNTFGAYIDGEAFASLDAGFPVKVIVEGGRTTIHLNGRGSNFGVNHAGFNAIKVTLPQGFLDYKGLMVLDAVELNLADPEIEVQMEIFGQNHIASVLNGVFHIKRAQNLLVDKVQEEVVLSGVFEFQALVDGEPISITNGRFDLGVGTHNFFKLN